LRNEVTSVPTKGSSLQTHEDEIFVWFLTYPPSCLQRCVAAEEEGGGDGKTKRTAPRKWSKQEDERLRDAVEIYGDKNWKVISTHLKTRTHTQCLQRWSRVLRPGLIKGAWSPEEDLLLKNCVMEYQRRQEQEEKEAGKQAGKKRKRLDVNKGSWRETTVDPGRWCEISSKIAGRTSKQCRERWCNHLDPNINRLEYTPEEDQLILDEQARLGNRWSSIARMLPGRTEDAVKIRWKSITRKKIREKSKENDSQKAKGAIKGEKASTKASQRRSQKNNRSRQPPHHRTPNIPHTHINGIRSHSTTLSGNAIVNGNNNFLSKSGVPSSTAPLNLPTESPLQGKASNFQHRSLSSHALKTDRQKRGERATPKSKKTNLISNGRGMKSNSAREIHNPNAHIHFHQNVDTDDSMYRGDDGQHYSQSLPQYSHVGGNGDERNEIFIPPGQQQYAHLHQDGCPGMTDICTNPDDIFEDPCEDSAFFSDPLRTALLSGSNGENMGHPFDIEIGEGQFSYSERHAPSQRTEEDSLGVKVKLEKKGTGSQNIESRTKDKTPKKGVTNGKGKKEANGNRNIHPSRFPNRALDRNVKEDFDGNSLTSLWNDESVQVIESTNSDMATSLTNPRSVHDSMKLLAHDQSSCIRLLFGAARCGRYDIVATFMSYGFANPNLRDATGRTACHEAARNGYVEVLNVLASHGADVNASTLKGVTIAHQAAFGGHVHFLRRLHELGASTRRVDFQGRTPLQIAMVANKKETVAFLESAEAETKGSNSERYALESS